MPTSRMIIKLSPYLNPHAALTLLFPWPGNPVRSAQEDTAYMEEVRALNTNDLGLLNLAGLAYSPDGYHGT